MQIIRNERIETREDKYGRERERICVTWDVVEAGSLIAECGSKREAVEEMQQRQLRKVGR